MSALKNETPAPAGSPRESLADRVVTNRMWTECGRRADAMGER